MITIRCKDVTFERIQAVLFDKDGTLAHSETFLRSLAQRRSRLIDAQVPGVQEPLLLAFGVEQNYLNPAGLMAVGSRLENEIAAAAYVAETGRGWVESVKIVQSAFEEADRYTANKAEQTPLIAGALNLVQTLATTGVTLGILSADHRSNLEDFVKRYGLDSLIPHLFGVDGYSSKADPALWQHCFSTLGTSPQATLMVGDSPLDVQIARQTQMAGCITVMGGWSTAVHLSDSDVSGFFADVQVERC